MGTIAEKLTYLNGTKQAIKQAIIDKGVAVADSDTFRSYAAKIAEIPSGSAKPQPDGYTGVFFYDYNGDLLHWYSVEDAQALTALPPINVQHERLVSEGWTHTLEEVKATTGRLNVGIWYHTISGNLEYKVVIDYPGMECILPIRGATVNWGDGNTDSYGSSVYTKATHIYTNPGIYYVECAGTLKSYKPYVGRLIEEIYLSTQELSTEVNFRGCGLKYIATPKNGASPAAVNRSAFASCDSLEFCTLPAANDNIKYISFSNCSCLHNIIIPEGWTYISAAFANQCAALESIVVPKSVTTIGSSQLFRYCYSLKQAVIPALDNLSYMFGDCYTLRKISLPEGLSYIGGSMFSDCYALEEVIIPNSVTTIGSNSFYNCENLKSVTIPDGVTQIGSKAFHTTYMRIMICKPITPPTIDTDSFGGYPPPIYVPDASVEAYKTATNWATLADKIKPMSEIGL